MKKIISYVMCLILMVSMSTVISAESDKSNLAIDNKYESAELSIITADNMIKTEVFYLNDNGENIPYKQEIYEEDVILQANARSGEVTHKKTSVAVITEGKTIEVNTRGAGSKNENVWDKSISYHFYATVYYNTRAESNGATSYSITRLTGHADVGDRTVALSSYHLNYGQVGLKSGTVTLIQQNKLNVPIYGESFDIKPNHGWSYVYSWGAFNMTVGQTQFYTLKRGSSTWSGDFSVLI